MANAFRRPWKRRKELAELAKKPLFGFGCIGDAIEALIWRTSYQSCQQMERRMADTADLLTAETDAPYVALWLCIITDRLRHGDRL